MRGHTAYQTEVYEEGSTDAERAATAQTSHATEGQLTRPDALRRSDGRHSFKTRRLHK